MNNLCDIRVCYTSHFAECAGLFHLTSLYLRTVFELLVGTTFSGPVQRIRLRVWIRSWSSTSSDRVDAFLADFLVPRR